jgi:hypothetical protein
MSICIVGAGFRGLGVLERIVAYSRKYGTAVRVNLIGPSERGPEQYDIDQPDYLLLNIVAGQVSMFPDSASVRECAPLAGPSLYEWTRERGLLLSDDGMAVGRTGRPVKADDFLPRRLLGEYLMWFRSLLIEQAPDCLEILERRVNATDLKTVDGRLVVELSDGTSIDADYVFVAVGQIHEPVTQPSATHDVQASQREIARPYPLPDQLQPVRPKETVAIAGLGLSAVDAILALTIGRGGRMDSRDGVDCYIPSGSEPQIIAFSRSGLPYRSRPVLGASLTYDPVVFTLSGIDALRAERGPKLDYDRDVLPLLFTELRVAYWRAKFGRDRGWTAAQNVVNEFHSAFKERRLESYLSHLETNDARFDPKVEYFGTLPSNATGWGVLKNAETYQSWLQRWLEDDLREARLGVGRSPLKAALEACREFRDVIRYAVDFGGLTDESADRFFSFHSETINRIVVGPQKERTAEMLALIRAGILRVPLGSNPSVTWDKDGRRWILSSSSLGLQHTVFADWLYLGVTNPLQDLTQDPYICRSNGSTRLLTPISSQQLSDIRN